jgi:hypothetical protein
MIEQLESRRLLAAPAVPALSFTVSPDGVLTINNARNVQIDDYGDRFGTGTPDGVIVLYDYTANYGEVIGDDEPTVTSIVVNGTKRADRISISLVTAVPITAYGNGGDDQFLVGGTGSGTVSLYGERGSDEFLVSADGAQNRAIDIVGGAGKDVFNGSPIA